MLGKLDFCMLNPFCSTNVYGLATLNTPKEKNLIVGLVLMHLQPPKTENSLLRHLKSRFSSVSSLFKH